MYKSILLLLISVFILYSCGNVENKENNDSSINLEIESTDNSKKDNLKIESIGVNKTEEKQEITFNKTEEKLYIGKKVEIKKGLSEELPVDIKIYGDNETYLNSNVNNYLFFVDNTSKGINDISLFYTNLLEKAGYTKINNEIPENETINENIVEEETEKTIDNLEFVIKNEAYIEPKEGELPSQEKKYKQRVLINIYNSTPENIEKGMGLKGNFIEIYYNQILF